MRKSRQVKNKSRLRSPWAVTPEANVRFLGLWLPNNEGAKNSLALRD